MQASFNETHFYKNIFGMEIKLPVSSYRTKLYWLHFMKWTDATSDLNITDLKRTFNLWEIWILKKKPY